MASSKPLQVKNRAPAPIQITAEQLIRESKEKQIENAPRAPKLYIADTEELQQYQQGKRKDFENQIRRQRHLIGTWCKYALWEATQKEFIRSRSVFERALDVDYRSNVLWFKYAEMEMKNKFINHARNVWDRAVSLLPRVDQFWYKYSYMEEMIGAIDEARQVFERWMKWQPDDMGWAAYIKFEMRQAEIERARKLYERSLSSLPPSVLTHPLSLSLCLSLSMSLSLSVSLSLFVSTDISRLSLPVVLI
jgi:crooked neck